MEDISTANQFNTICFTTFSITMVLNMFEW